MLQLWLQWSQPQVLLGAVPLTNFGGRLMKTTFQDTTKENTAGRLVYEPAMMVGIRLSPSLFFIGSKELGDEVSRLGTKHFGSRYRPSEVIRMSLATELPVVEAWLESLKSDPDAELAAVGAELAKATATGRQAVLAQATARQALRDFEAGERLALFSAVNTARTGLYAALRKLNDDVAWVESFFRPTPRRAADEPEELSVAEAQTLVKSREAELTTARAQLDAAQKREMAAQAAAAARDELTRERDAKKKEVAALMARVAELEGELGSNAR